MAPSSPSERKRLKTPRTGLLTCAYFSHLPRDEHSGSHPVVSRHLRVKRKNPG